jgi:hypothetical protein
MEPSSSPISQYYLKIQALTPASSSQSTTTAASPINPPKQTDYLSLSMYIFFGMLLVGIFGLLLTKTKNINKMIAVLIISLVTSAIPLAMNLSQQPADISSQAGPELIPKNVIIDQVNKTGFNIYWYTDKIQVGVVKLSLSPDMKTSPQIISEPNTQAASQHQLTIDQLQPDTTYYLQVLSGSDWYDYQGQAIKITTTR